MSRLSDLFGPSHHEVWSELARPPGGRAGAGQVQVWVFNPATREGQPLSAWFPYTMSV